MMAKRCKKEYGRIFEVGLNLTKEEILIASGHSLIKALGAELSSIEPAAKKHFSWEFLFDGWKYHDVQLRRSFVSTSYYSLSHCQH